MVKMKSLLVVAALFAVTVIGLASCAVKPEQALIGKWKYEDASGNNTVYEFKKKGEFSVSMYNASDSTTQSYNGTWTATDTTIIYIIGASTMAQPYTLSGKGKTLTLYDPGPGLGLDLYSPSTVLLTLTKQ